MLKRRLMLRASSAAIIVAASFAATEASAQGADQPGTIASPPVEQVTVTGTMIRGIQPVGSTLITVDPQQIQAMAPGDVQDVLVNVPSLTGFGNVNQGTTNSSSFAPTIHQLGVSASNSTLVLIDGHRMPSDGQNHGLTDPNIVPVSALQEIDVLADGSSSIYGSDAVAGVVNFVTRRTFEGLQVTLQDGFANGYRTTEANGIWGTAWGNGSVWFAASFSDKGSIANTDRLKYVDNNFISHGGTNFETFNCSPATIQPNGTGNIFLNATSGTSVANATANAPCPQPYGNFLDPERRSDFMVRGTEQVGNVTIGVDLLYAIRADDAYIPWDTAITATVFGTGAQANPFYVTPSGFVGVATKESVRVNLAGLFPLTPQYEQASSTGNQNGYIRSYTDWNIDDNFHLTLSGVIGTDRLYGNTYNGECTACAYLALNGTSSSSGSTAATVSTVLPTTSTTVSMLPLTASNALDIWNPMGSNKTSPAVIASLGSAQTQSNTYDQLQDFQLVLDGSPITLPGGQVRVAVGAESRQSGEKAFTDGAGVLGPSSNFSQATSFAYARRVYAYFGEIEVPIIGKDNAIPFVEKLGFDISGRYDDYSDVGTTANPKFAADWTPVDGVKIHGTYSTSFVAPALDSIGKPPGYFAVSSQFNTPFSLYPNCAQIPGVTVTPTYCTIPSTDQGIELSGAQKLKPELGRGWSIGADFAPDFLPGATLNVTYWDASFKGGVTSPFASTITESAYLSNLIVLYPTGITQAQLASYIANSGGNTSNAPQTASLPPIAYYTFDERQQNVLNLWIQGIDLAASYDFDTDGYGHFRLTDNLTQFTEFDQSYGQGGQKFSILNTSGYNQTFPSIATTMRATIGWSYEKFFLQFALDYTGAYKNWSSNSVAPLVLSAQGNPSSGGDHVNSSVLFDLHASYDFHANIYGYDLGYDQVYINVQDLFDTNPPFFNSPTGYNTFAGNPIGRIVAIGVTGKF